MKNKLYIISLGGSLLVNEEEINWKFLREFKELIEGKAKQGYRFIIVTGGGKTARKYIKGAQKVDSNISADSLDWIGIHATRLNAYLVKHLFGKLAHEDIIINPNIKVVSRKKIIIGGGFKPGWSTDYVSVLLAKRYGAQRVINLSNIDYVYDKDPRKHKNALPIKNIDWTSFQRIVGTDWKPGINVPFDPIATKMAKKLGLEVVIMNGKRTSNIRNYLKGEKFRGTVIS